MSEKKITAKIEKKDDGYYFPELDIHVIASDEAGARKAVLDGHGIDVDKEAERIAEQQKADKKSEGKG